MTRLFGGVFRIMSLVLLLGSGALAQTTSHILTMTGQGTARAVPDQVEISAGVTTDALTAAAALAANTSRMTGVFAALEKLGVPQKNIQTQNFSISPEYANGSPNNPPRLTGYRVNNEVHVLLEDAARVGAALDALVTAGANQMNGLSFSIKDTTSLLRKARADAVSDARAKAEQYAAAVGVSLGPILSLSENGAPQVPMFAPMAAMRVGKAVPTAAGEESITADVSIVWEIH